MLENQDIPVYGGDLDGVECFNDDIPVCLKQIYENATLVLVFISKNYLISDYTQMEWDIIQNEQEKRKNQKYLVPIRLDNTPILGLSNTKYTFNYLDLTMNQLCTIIQSIFKETITRTQRWTENIYI